MCVGLHAVTACSCSAGGDGKGEEEEGGGREEAQRGRGTEKDVSIRLCIPWTDHRSAHNSIPNTDNRWFHCVCACVCVCVVGVSVGEVKWGGCPRVGYLGDQFSHLFWISFLKKS